MAARQTCPSLDILPRMSPTHFKWGLALNGDYFLYCPKAQAVICLLPLLPSAETMSTDPCETDSQWCWRLGRCVRTPVWSHTLYLPCQKQRHYVWGRLSTRYYLLRTLIPNYHKDKKDDNIG